MLFAPEDLALVKGDPGERRRFLDELITARSPRMAGVRSDYERVLKQRNTLLKSAALARRHGGRGDGPVARWTCGTSISRASAPSCSRSGSIWSRRCGRWRTRRTSAGPRRRAGGPGVPLVARRRGEAGDGPATREALLGERAARRRWPRRRKQEIERGVTLVGPHRDDLVLKLGELPARGYASHGESWSFALALRLAAYDLLRADGGDPVLVLDDVFAELDTRRRAGWRSWSRPPSRC